MCDLCHGNYNNCPVCGEDDMQEIICPDCNGFPELYFNDLGETMLKEDWDALQESERGPDTCAKCEGKGVIYVEIPNR